MPQTATVSIRIPTALRDCCRGALLLSMEAPDVRAMLEGLEQNYPKLHRSICDETGALRRHINVFVNISSIRDGAGPATVLAQGDVVTILTAVSGG